MVYSLFNVKEHQIDNCADNQRRLGVRLARPCQVN